MRNHNAFTLIELLVVVAIIIALLAILLPSLNRAIYAAQFAVCGSNLHQTGVGTLSYAADHLGAYPARKLIDGGKVQPWQLRRSSIVEDFRPTIKDYIAINELLNCPLSGQNDYEGAIADVWVDYNLYTGFGYIGEKAMKRVGNAWTYNGKSYRLLAGDIDKIFPTLTRYNGTHPDREGASQLHEYNNQNSVFGHIDATFSFWYTAATQERGLVDTNHLYDDLSVRPLYNVAFDDDRVDRLPGRSNPANSAPDSGFQVPATN